MIEDSRRDAGDDWAAEWAYESDQCLVHDSGLKIRFDRPEETAVGLRSDCLGDFVADTVMISRAHMVRAGMSEVDSVKSTTIVLRQATNLYRHFQPGSAGAPINRPDEL